MFQKIALIVAVAGSIAAAAPSATLAQRAGAPAVDTASHPVHSPDNGPFISWREPLIGAGFAAAALLAAPHDEAWARRIQRPAVQDNSTLHSTARIRVLGDPGALIITAGMYGVGRLASNPGLADAGLHSTEAVVLASGITTVLKGLIGRARPSTVADSDASDFHFGRGFGDSRYASLPSGHATAAFAAAAALASEAAEHHVGGYRYIGVASYGLATLVAASRVYDNDHWTSDVITGAGIGTLSGILVVRAMHRHPANRIDRWLLGMTVVPVPDGGVALGWSSLH